VKLNSLIIFIMAAFFLAGCSDNKSTTNEKQKANTSISEKKEESTPSHSAQGDDIVGKWELVGFIGDINDNLQIDEDEKKNLKPVSYKDYMKINGDGSGLFTVAKMEGRYEITDEGNGKKYMTWYDKGNGEHRIGTIIKVTKDELHIKEPGGSGLFLWKRL
jgi:hypothetical protein